MQVVLELVHITMFAGSSNNGLFTKYKSQLSKSWRGKKFRNFWQRKWFSCKQEFDENSPLWLLENFRQDSNSLSLLLLLLSGFSYRRPVFIQIIWPRTKRSVALVQYHSPFSLIIDGSLTLSSINCLTLSSDKSANVIPNRRQNASALYHVAFCHPKKETLVNVNIISL